MKNIHLLTTNKQSRLWVNNLKRRLELDSFPSPHPYNVAKNIYIISDEKIKEDDWVLNTNTNSIAKYTGHGSMDWWVKIILTTDQDLIKDGVQAIDDEFLEWFVKNPSYDEVNIFEKYNQEKNACVNKCKLDCHSFFECENVDDDDLSKSYKIIIPKENPKVLSKIEIAKNIASIGIGGEKTKHETIEEAAERLVNRPYGNVVSKSSFIEGAKSDAAREYWFEYFKNNQ
jgi:hypothetical protein